LISLIPNDVPLLRELKSDIERREGERITQKEAIKDGRNSSKEIECIIMMMNTTVIAESRRRSNVSFFMDPLP